MVTKDKFIYNKLLILSKNNLNLMLLKHKIQMLQLFKLQENSRIKIVYGKIISQDNTSLVYYDSEKNLVRLSKELEIENMVRTIGFKVPSFLNNVPIIGEEPRVFEREGVNSTYKRTIETIYGQRGIEIIIQTTERAKKLDKILETKKVKIGEYFEYNLLNL